MASRVRPVAKQKRVRRSKDKPQSERFIETAKKLAADESPEVFKRVLEKMVPPKRIK